MAFRCSVCGYIYGEEKLPDSYECPVCHQTGRFEPYTKEDHELPETS
ncbi:MAG: rubredoxin-like domain-containing protein, partial [Lachnospiraceae bacterium]